MTEAAIDQLLAEARAAIAPRVEPAELSAEADAGALIVDLRPQHQRARDGAIPHAVVIDRNVLEWRLDPTSPYRSPVVTGPDQRIVLVCDEGHQSSLAAATLRQLGLTNVTDLVGGVQAWLTRPRGGDGATAEAVTSTSVRVASQH